MGSPWAVFEMAPQDPIIGLNEEFAKDDYPHKEIVGVGAYRDDEGNPYVLPCVREAEKKLLEQKLDMEYSGIVSLIISGAFAFRSVGLAVQYSLNLDLPLTIQS